MSDPDSDRDDGGDLDEERTIIRPPQRPRPQERALPATSLGHTLPIGTRLYDYEITGLIGEGGFGIVYHATDHSLQRHVAIKEYMPATMVSRQANSSAIVVKSERMLDTFRAGLKSFVNEARLLARFDHPSLLKVYRFWEENGTAYMVMPYYEGPTLKDALAGLGRAPTEGELRAWLDPLLDALAVLHQTQCYHRDIAPDNILLTAGGPLLLDFGAARRVIGDMTHALTVMLKPGYAPIEQYGDVASMSQGAWTDFYALASVVYYAITGRPPVSSVERLMDDRLEPLSRLAAGRYSPEFLAGIDRALSVRPQDRPQNDAQFRAALGDPPRDPGPSTRGGLYAVATGAGALDGAVRTAHAFPATRQHVHTTVPGPLTPELATELQARTALPEPPLAAAPPVAHAPAPAVARPPQVPSGPAPDVGPSARAAPPVAPTRRRGATIAVAITLLLALGVAAAWWTTRSPAEAPATAAVPVPVEATAPITSDSRSAAPSPLPANPVTASPATQQSGPVEIEEKPAAATPAAIPAPALPARVADRPAAAATRPQRAAVERERPATPALSTPSSYGQERSTSPAPSPRAAPAGARCSDILQKASLEALTSEEAAYLRRHCQ